MKAHITEAFEELRKYVDAAEDASRNGDGARLNRAVPGAVRGRAGGGRLRSPCRRRPVTGARGGGASVLPAFGSQKLFSADARFSIARRASHAYT